MDLLDAARDALGGGTLSLWMLVLGAIAIWLAVKAVVGTVKLALFVAAGVMLLGVAPWSGGEPASGAAAQCAADAVAEANSGVQAVLTKRVTVDEVSPDAVCAGETGLAQGTATVRVRTWADVPFRTWTVSPDGATPR